MNKLVKIMIFLFLSVYFISTNEMKYPFIYIPGMFDNGDGLIPDSLLVKNLNNPDGFYFQHYFTDQYSYNTSSFYCSSNLVGSKYNRLIVANLIGPYRTNISIWLMADRFFCLMHGRAPYYKNYNILTKYKGNDFSGSFNTGSLVIWFKGIIEETWAKYGKKVYYQSIHHKNVVILSPKNPNNSHLQYYINPDGYFNTPEEIKFNCITHSCGGIAIRRYIDLCLSEKLTTHINLIINLSVPQQGARTAMNLKNAFPALIHDTVEQFYKNINQGTITVKDAENNNITYSYQELQDKTRIGMLKGNRSTARFMQALIGNYILYFIPFDGRHRVLGTDPMLYDLHPDHKLINHLNRVIIPEDIPIFNYRVLSPYCTMFSNIGKYLKLDKNDGVVDLRDTDISHLPNTKNLKITDIFVDKANHIPFPYIKPVFELRETINQNYLFLKILLKESVDKKTDVTIILAFMQAIMAEFGLNLEKILKDENYSVIDYFAENPLEFFE